MLSPSRQLFAEAWLFIHLACIVHILELAISAASCIFVSLPCHASLSPCAPLLTHAGLAVAAILQQRPVSSSGSAQLASSCPAGGAPPASSRPRQQGSLCRKKLSPRGKLGSVPEREV